MAIKKDEAKKPAKSEEKALCPAGVPHEFADYGRCIRCGEPE